MPFGRKVNRTCKACDVLHGIIYAGLEDNCEQIDTVLDVDEHTLYAGDCYADEYIESVHEKYDLSECGYSDEEVEFLIEGFRELP